MGQGIFKVYSFVMGAASTTATVNTGRAFSRVYLQVPTMASTTALDLYASADGGSSYYQVRKDMPNTTTVQSWSFVVAASMGANGCITPVQNGLQYMKLVATDSAPAGAQSFQLLCSDD